jgi:MscS family membrane protein
MEALTQFWGIVINVWKTGFLSTGFDKWLVSAIIMILFLLFRSLFTRFILVWLKSLTNKTSTNIDGAAIELLEQPIRFIPVVLGVFFATEHLALEGIFKEISGKMVRSLIVITIFWGLLRLIMPISRMMSVLETIFTPELVDWIIKALRISIILIATATVLQVWGVQVAPIIAGAGLFGVAVALGAQDLFKNLIGGLLILGEKRFRKGEWIRVDGIVEGTVENIGFRSTVIRRFDKAPVMVPNTNLSDTAVTNFSQMTHRRIYWNIGIEYGASVGQLKFICDSIEEYIVNSNHYVPKNEAECFVNIDKFSESSIDIMVYCFTKTTEWGEWLKIKENLAYKIKDVVQLSGTAFAFPSQSVYIKEFAGQEAEVFIPPHETV